jgi:hypothetical protein
MLTIFTIPKAFEGHIEVIQRNAIQSWLCLKPHCEIILCGDDKGVASVAKEFGLKHLVHVERNEYGTPLLNSAFEQVQRVARYPLICYVNCDIILLSDFITTISKVNLKKFLIVGQRWDLEVEAPIEFVSNEWEKNLKEKIAIDGTLHAPAGSDYFIFPKNMFGSIPPFIIGRPGWDNWFIYKARALGVPVIDASEMITIIHQNHDYGHIPEGRKDTYYGPEADYNIKLVGGAKYMFLLKDATFRFKNNKMVKVHDDINLIKKLERQLILNEKKDIISIFFVKLIYICLFILRKLFHKGSVEAFGVCTNKVNRQ